MIVGVVAMMVFSELGSATTVCPMAKSQIIDARALTGFIEDVNVIGKPDRQTAQDFARNEAGGSTALDIEQRYAASGACNHPSAQSLPSPTSKIFDISCKAFSSESAREFLEIVEATCNLDQSRLAQASRMHKR